MPTAARLAVLLLLLALAAAPAVATVFLSTATFAGGSCAGNATALVVIPKPYPDCTFLNSSVTNGCASDGGTSVNATCSAADPGTALPPGTSGAYLVGQAFKDTGCADAVAGFALRSGSCADLSFLFGVSYYGKVSCGGAGNGTVALYKDDACSIPLGGGYEFGDKCTSGFTVSTKGGCEVVAAGTATATRTASASLATSTAGPTATSTAAPASTTAVVTTSTTTSSKPAAGGRVGAGWAGAAAAALFGLGAAGVL